MSNGINQIDYGNYRNPYLHFGGLTAGQGNSQQGKVIGTGEPSVEGIDTGLFAKQSSPISSSQETGSLGLVERLNRIDGERHPEMKSDTLARRLDLTA